MKIMTLGNGYVANHLPYTKILERIPANHQLIKDILNYYKPDCLINAIGFCGRPNVDECEIKKSQTYLANVTIPSILAEACEQLGIHMIQLGSGCIYFGESPHAKKFHTPEKIRPDSLDYKSDEWTWMDPGWKEDDFANPKSFYSKTKYACDLIIGQMPHVTTLRLRMPISTKNDSRNFINKIRGYNQLIDIPNSMTFMDDLVRCVDWAAKESKFGIYHVTNPQPTSAAQVMNEYKRYIPDHNFKIINEAQLDSLVVAKRSNCILNTDKLNNAGFFMTPTEEALKTCMAEYIKN